VGASPFIGSRLSRTEAIRIADAEAQRQKHVDFLEYEHWPVSCTATKTRGKSEITSTCLLSSAFTPVFWRMAERPCLKVMLARPTQENERKIPREIEGYPVVTEISGEIRPLRP